jgi:hypothetical protein
MMSPGDLPARPASAAVCGLSTPINNFRTFRAILWDRAVAGLQTPYYITPDTNRSSRGPFLEGMGAFRGKAGADFLGSARFATE